MEGKQKNWIRNGGIFLLCLILGMGLVLASRSSDGQRLYVSRQTIGDLQVTIDSEIKDIGNLKLLVADAEKRLIETEQLAGENTDELRQVMEQDLELYRQILGLTDLEGEGVEVILDDATRELYYAEENVNNLLVHDSDLLTIINDLNAAGAEAISLNGQRIINTSEISCSGYTVRVNRQFYARPFVIRAIGDSKRMAAALIGPDGYGTLLRAWGLTVKVAIQDKVFIPKLTEEKSLKYVSIVEETEAGEQN